MSSLRSKTYKWPAQVLHLVCLWPHPSAATVLFIWFPAFVPASLNVLGVILTNRTPRLPLPLYLTCCGCRELWILFIFCWDEQVWKTRVCEGGVLKAYERLGVGSPPRGLRITGHLLPVWSLKRTTHTVHSPTDEYLLKLRLQLILTLDGSYVFRSTTIIRELAIEPG